MRKIIYSFLILVCLAFLGYPLKSESQNKYSVKVIQPDPVTAPVINSVTVTAENKNLISWEIQPNENIRYFNIYRDALNNNGEWVYAGRTIYPGNFSFTDLNSYPTVRSYQYRIAAVDQCGNEVYNTIIHKTIKLNVDKTTDNTYSLKWNSYEGLKVTNYEIYRGKTADALIQIDSTANSDNTYTDQLTTSENIFYRIEAVGYQNNVNNEKNISLRSFKTYSNIVSGKNILSSSDSLDALRITIYPNPMVNSAMVQFPYDPAQNYQLFILDISGRTVYQKPIFSGSIEIERENLREGMYILQIAGKKVFRKKLMVGRE